MSEPVPTPDSEKHQQATADSRRSRCRLFHDWSGWEDVPIDDDWLPPDDQWRLPMQRRRCRRCNRCDHRRTLA